MSVQPTHRYLAKAPAKSGARFHAAKSAFAQMNKIAQFGSLPIVSLNHLGVLAGVPTDYLRRIVRREFDPYKRFSRRKSTSGWRPIMAPERSLMSVQRLLLDQVLNRQDFHPACYSYVPGRSVVDCAQLHVGAKWLIKLDIHNFFGSIDERRVYHVYRSLGYSSLVSFELARISTAIPSSADPIFPNASSRYSVIEDYASPFAGVLPQGAPTSGALANLVSRRLDSALSEYSSQNGFIYSRYSDDIVLSTGLNENRESLVRAIRSVSGIIGRLGFTVHRRKTRLVSPRSRKIVLGLIVETDGVFLPKEFKRRLELRVHSVQKFGLFTEARKCNFASFIGFIAHIEGCISYAHSVEPAWAGSMRKRWIDALGSSGVPAVI